MICLMVCLKRSRQLELREQMWKLITMLLVNQPQSQTHPTNGVYRYALPSLEKVKGGDKADASSSSSSSKPVDLIQESDLFTRRLNLKLRQDLIERSKQTFVKQHGEQEVGRFDASTMVDFSSLKVVQTQATIVEIALIIAAVVFGMQGLFARATSCRRTIDILENSYIYFSCVPLLLHVSSQSEFVATTLMPSTLKHCSLPLEAFFVC
jgi:hypothetical protein